MNVEVVWLIFSTLNNDDNGMIGGTLFSERCIVGVTVSHEIEAYPHSIPNLVIS